MEIVTSIAPIALAIIMLGLGLGLSIDDFTRVVRQPRDFFLGVICRDCDQPLSLVCITLQTLGDSYPCEQLRYEKHLRR